MLLATNGCSGLDMAMNDLEGSLVGDAFTVRTYDDGDSVLEVHGNVDVEAETADEDGDAHSSVIDVTA